MRPSLFMLVVAAGCTARGVPVAPTRWSPADGHVVSGQLARCSARFAPELRARWHTLEGARYLIDDAGRPAGAEILLPPIVEGQRHAHCQAEVGRWGDQEDPANDYDGGHLIGDDLGGAGARVNMVPQHVRLNRGQWRGLEQHVKRCARLAPGRLRYRVDVHYPDPQALIPDTMTVTLVDTVNDEQVVLTFENARDEGAKRERQRAAAWLNAHGCG